MDLRGRLCPASDAIAAAIRARSGALLSLDPISEFAETPIVSAVDGQVPRKETVAFPAPDRHVRNGDQVAQLSTRQESLSAAIVGATSIVSVLVCHGPHYRATVGEVIRTALEKDVTRRGS